MINDLRKAASTADAVYLAGDPDREGEAISAHLAMVLSKPREVHRAESRAPTAIQDGESGGRRRSGSQERQEIQGQGQGPEEEISIPPTDPKKIFRVTFNEITPKAIRAAFEHPRAGGYEPGGRAAGTARARPHRGLQNFAAALEQGAPRPIRRTRANRRAAADRRARAGNPRVRAAVSTGRSTRCSMPASRRSSKPSSVKYKGEEIAVANQEAADYDRRRGQRRPTGRWRASRKRKRGAIRRRRSPRRSCSRPPTIACATPPSAPWRSRSGCTKASSWATKARSR